VRNAYFTKSVVPGVEKLKRTYGSLEDRRGSVLKYAELEACLGIKHMHSHFKSIMSIWREYLKQEFGIWLRGDTGETRGRGLKVLSHDEQVAFSGTRYRQAAGRVADGVRAAINTDPSQLSGDMRIMRERRIQTGTSLSRKLLES